MSETPDMTVGSEPTAEELEAQIAELTQRAVAKKAAEEKEARLPSDKAKAQELLVEAEAELKAAEGPYWDLQHAQRDALQAKDEYERAPEKLKPTWLTVIEEATADLEKANAAFQQPGAYDRAKIDQCAERVLELREHIASFDPEPIPVQED